MTVHTVEPGETLASIAQKHLLPNERVLYDAPENRDYLATRPDPHTLHPGDEVFVPETPLTDGTLKTGSSVRIVVQLKRLRLEFHDATGAPLANADAHVELERNQPLDTTTDETGRLDLPVRGHPTQGRVVIGDQSWELNLGHLNPLEATPDHGVSGAQDRLHNLGYAIGERDGKLGPKTRAALRALQREAGLEVTGQLDESTLTCLLETHRQ